VRWRLLSDVPEEDVRLLLTVARRRRFERGEVVFHRDDPGDSLHLIVSGRFAVRVMTPLGDMVWIAALARTSARWHSSTTRLGALPPSQH